MVDTRFHISAGPLPLWQLISSSRIKATFEDRHSAVRVFGAEELDLADSTHVSLAAHRDYALDMAHSRAGVLIVHPDLRSQAPPGAVLVIADAPHEIFADFLDLLYPLNTLGGMAGSTAEDRSLLIEPTARIGENVVIGKGVEIGEGTVIGPNTVIGNGVAIGRHSIIGANCTIECAYLGDRVVIHSGVRIGTEGFGWLDHGRSNRKIPQLGRAIIQDRVEIGANSTVDRGALGDTVIGDGTKIDNLVQIGHNCRIGRNCLIAGQSGLSGSTILGDGVMLGGGVGTVGHLTIGSGSVVVGRAVVTKSLAPGSRVAGYPAQDIRGWRREIGVLRRLAKGTRGDS